MKFQFELKGEQFNPNEWASDNCHLVGDLQIYVDGQLYFTETHITIVGLAKELGKWLAAMQHDLRCNFIYYLIDRDEPILLFDIQQDRMKLHSPIEQFEPPALPVETVKYAVLRFLVALNEQLHKIDYIEKLDRFLTGVVTENTKAILLLEQNEYEESLALFKKLAEEAPSVQSLNNYAWMFLREEEDRDEAERLLQQVLAFEPQSSFPYMMLGEIAIHKQQYEEAKSYLQQALSFSETEEATYNLALAHFQLGAYEQAAQTFALCVGDSGLTQLNEVVSWVYAGMHDKAKALLEGWNAEADDYTGAIEIADVYMELGQFVEAREQFEKEWNSYYTSPYIVSRFAYALWQLQDKDACHSIIQHAIQQNKEEIKDEQQAELDEHWTAQDRDERIVELTRQQQTLEALSDKLQNGYVPAFEYDIYPMGGCQLFGCVQHGNLEYKGA